VKILEIQKKDSKNVKVIFDNDTELIIDFELILKNGLRKDKEISESHFDFLKIENQKLQIHKKALDYLSRRIHSSKELKRKLLQKKFDSELINEVTSLLQEKKIIDDYNFAAQFIEEKLKLKMWGKKKLQFELMKKGISRDIIEELILNIPEADEKNKLNILVQKKLGSLLKRNYDEKKIKEKLLSFLTGKGYDYYSALGAVEECLKNQKDYLHS
jgi:regulatory protein